MANANPPFHHLHLIFLLTLFLAAVCLQPQGCGAQTPPHEYDHRTMSFKDGWKRLLIGSVAPSCSYNECRGCKYRCMAEQVPIEGNDPINSAYYYKCVCHR